MDNRAVHLLTNYHGTEESNINRRQKDGSKVERRCPQVIKDYNANMGGVDKHNMLRSRYGLDRKSPKWWHSVL